MTAEPIKHVSEFVKFIENNSAIYEHDPRFLYRGEKLTTFSLIPSIFRKMENNPNEYLYLKPNTEIKIMVEFMIDAVGYTPSLSPDEFSRWIEYAQHFGVPTRLLDWTRNPLIALYFACEDKFGSDGKVYLLHSKAYAALLEKNDQMNNAPLKDEVAKMVLGRSEGFRYPKVYSPFHFDARMNAQGSRFLVWGTLEKPLNEIIQELEKEGPVYVSQLERYAPAIVSRQNKKADILTEIIVSGKYKKRMLHELDSLGINQATIYPGLDGLGQSIKWRNDKTNKNDLRFD